MMVNNDLEKSFSSGDCLKNSSVIDEKAKAISSVNIMSTKSRRPRTQNLENSHDCKVKRCPPEYVTHEKHKKAANIKCNRKCSVQNKFGTIKMCWAMSMKFAFCSKNAKFWG